MTTRGCEGHPLSDCRLIDPPGVGVPVTLRTADTIPEKLLRDFLRDNGYLDDQEHQLPFNPDIVFDERKVAVFMHGCFWHRHPGCRQAYEVDGLKHPSWLVKFAANVERDKKDVHYLASHGWRILVVWECALNAKKRRTKFLPRYWNGSKAMKNTGKFLPNPL